MAGTKKSGRKPKSISMLKLSGNYRLDRHKSDEIELSLAVPEAPEYLKGAALEEWKRVMAILSKTHLVTELDITVLAVYCMEFKKYKEANEKLDAMNSMVAVSSKKTPTVNPLVRISDRALSNMLRAISELGLSPMSRRALRIELKAPADSKKARFFEKS